MSNVPQTEPLTWLDRAREINDRAVAAQAALDAAAREFEDLLPEVDSPVAAAIIYWEYPNIPAKPLRAAVMSVTGIPHKDWLTLVSECSPYIVRCPRCGSATATPSRSAKQRGPSQVCRVCIDRGREKQQQIWAAGDERRSERLEMLRTMPYREYLKTDEWQQRRKMKLRSARFKCQVCNAGKTILDVHHRTYARRGDEDLRDLTVLCRDCHTLFTFQGKLVTDDPE